MKLTFTLFTILFLHAACPAQDWFNASRQGEKVPGWVVNLAGDTLRGHITYRNPGVMSYKIFFWDEKTPTDRQKYKGKDLKGYFFEGVYWESIRFNDGSIKLSKDQSENLFVRTVIKGRLSLYELYTLENEKLLEQEGNVINVLPMELKTELHLQKDGGKMEGLNDIKFVNFKKAMGKIVADCAVVAAKVESKEYGKRDLYKIVNEYNQQCGK